MQANQIHPKGSMLINNDTSPMLIEHHAMTKEYTSDSKP